MKPLNRREFFRLSVLALVVSAPAYATGPMSCASLAGLRLPDTTITTATVVPAGTFNPAIVTTACRVAGSIKPTSDSDIRFEVWMPTEGWNGKFLSAGEGGYAGSINYGGIGGALRRGYAGGSTDTGHVGGTADFAPGHPEKVTDFGWRGKHLQAARSKDIIRAFYGKSIKHSYFSSCSNGGRQALMEIQRFPEDYDGVLVGAPANNWTHHFAGFVWNEQALFSTPGAHLSASKLAAVQAETLRTCDALDGVVDGVAEDPRRCKFDPASIACPAGTDGPSCLTPPQVSAVRKIMQGPRNPRTGRQIYPGYFTSAAGEPASWPAWITGPPVAGASIQAFFGNGFFGRIVEEIPAPGVWDWAGFDFDRDMAFADRKTERTMNATEADLGRFTHRNRRGKIIMWHGWEDPAISGADAVDYYRQVVRENDDSHGLLPPLHGAGDAPLRRRARTQRLRPVPAAGAAAQQLAAARHPQRARALGRGRRRAREDHRGEVRERPAGAGHRAHASALRVSEGRGLQGPRQHQRCRELQLPHAERREARQARRR